MNINLMKFNLVTNVTDYVNSLTSSGCNLFIDRPTRIADRSATCIDHVYSNFAPDRLENFVLLSDVSDHYSTLTKIDRFQKRNVKGDVYSRKRNLSDPEWDEFNKDLNKILTKNCHSPDQNRDNNIDVNSYADNITDSYMSLIDKYMPLRKLSRKEKKFLDRPWITKGLKVSIAKKMIYINNQR